MKVCTKCGVEKEFSDFNKQKASNDGYVSSCKFCRTKWYQANKEHRVEYNKKWYQANKERSSESHKKWYQANKEHKAEYDKKWYQTNKKAKQTVD